MFPLKYPNYAFHKMLYNLQDLIYLFIFILFINQFLIKLKIIEQFNISINTLFHNSSLFTTTEHFWERPIIRKVEYKEKFCPFLLDSIQNFCLARTNHSLLEPTV